MVKQIILLFSLLAFFGQTAGAQSATISAPPLAQTTYCTGERFILNYIATGSFLSGNQFVAQLSDASGSFTSPTAVGSVASSQSGNIEVLIPSNLTPGNNYRIRVVSTAPAVLGAPSNSVLNIIATPSVIISPASASITLGSSITLNALGASAYSWVPVTGLSGSSGASVVASPATTTTYTVTGVNGSCRATATVTVTVSPTANFLRLGPIEPPVLCAGGALAVSFTGSGVFNNNNSFIVELSDRNGNFNNPLQIGSLAGAAPGLINAFVPNNLPDGNGYRIRVVSTSPRTESNVSELPLSVQRITPVSASVSPESFCIGTESAEGPAVLAASNIAGAAYLWEGPAGFRSSERVALVRNINVNSAGLYTVTVNIGSCRVIGTARLNISRPAINFTINSNAPVCGGNTLRLTAQGTFSGADSAYWDGPNGFFSSSPAVVIPNFSNANAGVYRFIAKQTGCTPYAQSVTVEALSQTPQAVITSNSPVCGGRALMLSAETIPGATYQWSGPEGFEASGPMVSRRITSETQAGTYTLTVIAGNCPSSTSTAEVEVIPPLRITPNANAVCKGGSILLRATAYPGASYRWIGPNNLDITTLEPSLLLQNMQPFEAGTYFVQTTHSFCGALGASVNIDVSENIANLFAESNSPICVGNEVSLRTGIIPGAAYRWSGPNNYTSTAAAPTFLATTSLQSGLYSVRVSVPGCDPVQASTKVEVLTAPRITLSSNAPICADSSLILNATPFPGAIYRWRGPEGLDTTTNFSQLRLSRLNFNQRGTYYLEVSTPSCGSAQLTTNVEVAQRPNRIDISTNSPICYSEDLILVAERYENARYQWSGPDDFFSLEKDAFIRNATESASGKYTLKVTVAGCTPLIETIQVRVAPQPGIRLRSNIPLCAEDILRLTADYIEGATYQWRGPNLSVSGGHTFELPLTLENLGRYYVSATLFNGQCNLGSDTLTIDRLYLVEDLAAESNSPVCVNNSLLLRAASVPGATYEWFGPQGFRNNTQNPSLFITSSLQAGLYTVRATLPGCKAVEDTVRVEVLTPQNVILQDNTPLCIDSTLKLFTNNFPRGTYKWTGPNNFRVTTTIPWVTRQNVSKLDDGVYQVEIQTDGCPPLFAAKRVVINRSPILRARSNSPVCAGNSIFLTANGIENATYFWSGPNGYASSEQNPMLALSKPEQSGLYTVIAQVEGCDPVRDTTTVQVNPNADASFRTNEPLCGGKDLQLTGNAYNGATYRWRSPLGLDTLTIFPSLKIENVSRRNAGFYSLTIFLPGCLPIANQQFIAEDGLEFSISSNSPVCNFTSLLFETTAPRVAAFQWQGPNGFTSTERNPRINNVIVANEGVYTLSVTTPACPEPIIRTSEVQVIRFTPRAVNDGPVCVGRAFQLSVVDLNDNVRNAARYLWTGPDNFRSVTNTNTIDNATPLQEGFYNVEVSLERCPTQLLSTFVRVYDAPTARILRNRVTTCVNQRIAIPIELTGKGPWRIGYALNGVPFSVEGIEQPYYELEITPPSPGLWNLELTELSDGPNCNPGQILAGAVAVIEAKPELIITADITPASCAGDDGKIIAAATGGNEVGYLFILDRGNRRDTSLTGAFANLAVGLYQLQVQDAICSKTISLRVEGTASPRIIDQTSNSNSITVEWTAIPGANFYTLGYRAAGSSENYQIIPNLRRNIQTIKNLQAGQSYEIVVQALCRNNINTPFSPPVIIRTNNFSDCNAPEILRAVELSANEALLYFSPGSDGVRCYIVRYGLLANAKSSWTMIPVQSPENSVYVANLLAGREYGYEVLSNCSFCSPNSGSFSAWSATHRFLTPNARLQAEAAASIASLKVYPNPSKGRFTLSMESDSAENCAYTLTDPMGKLVARGNLEVRSGENLFDFNFENLSKGLYIFTIRQEVRLQSIKLIIE